MESQRSIEGEDHSGAGALRTWRLLTRADSSAIVCNATLRFEGGVISSVARNDASRDVHPDMMIIQRRPMRTTTGAVSRPSPMALSMPRCITRRHND